MKKLSFAVILTFAASHAVAANFYVDASHPRASDSNSGLSKEMPLKTLAGVHLKKVNAGDSILIKRGTSYTGFLQILATGKPTQRVLITSYGEGTPPRINALPSAGAAIELKGSYATVENLKLSGAGVRVWENSQGNLIRNLEISEAAIGIVLSGPRNQVQNVEIRDLKLSQNTPGGDDDDGAIGIQVAAPFNEISNSRCLRCKSESYDFGEIGTFVELKENSDSTQVHHNSVIESGALFKVSKAQSVRNVRFAYNEVMNSGLGGLRLSRTTQLKSFSIENNTIFENKTRNHPLTALLWVSGGQLNPESMVFRNNIVVAHSYRNIFAQDISRSNNVYHLLNPFTTLQNGEKTLANNELIGDPLFVDPEMANFRLQAKSPAIDRGFTLGHSSDRDGKSLFGAAWDIGAYEFSSVSELPRKSGADRSIASVEGHSK